jgi:hypothetical protein
LDPQGKKLLAVARGTFQRREDRWLLHEVNPTRDDSLLNKPNEIAGLTEVELCNAKRLVITL